MSAEERRESVLRAAMVEFAHGGFNGTSTAAIAARVGVSQPYLFRLFPNKRELFAAAARRCFEDVKAGFVEAAAGLPPKEARDAMGLAYVGLIEDRTRLLLQLQIYVSTAAAEAGGDASVGEEVRAMWLDLWDTVSILLGGDPAEATSFFADGMLINALVAMGFPPEAKVWAHLDPDGDGPRG